MGRTSGKRVLTIVVVTVASVYVIACISLFLGQRSLIYHPTRSISNGPNISIESGGNQIRVLTRQINSDKAVIYFGGNAEDVSVPLLSIGEGLKTQDLYFVNYRGYGGSTGSPSEFAVFQDALATYDLVSKTHHNISVIGRSLGSGVAIYLASMRQVERLVLITPYDSIENVAQQQFPIFPVGLILQDKFDSASRVKEVRAKTLMILADNDEIIPRNSSERLILEFPPSQVETQVILGSTHNSVAHSSEYVPTIVTFLEAR